MKLILELSQNDIHQYYRLLVFPSLTNGNPHRVCELLSVYLLFEESSSTVLPQFPQSDHIGTNFPTPPKSPRRSIKTMFRRNQKIHIGLTPLSSDVLSALFSSQEVDSLNQLTPKSVESLITRWIYKFDELQKTKLKSNYSLLDFHFQEIMWTSRHIILFQQYCLDDEIPSKLKKTQRESPFTITSINTLRSRLIQVFDIFFIFMIYDIDFTIDHRSTLSCLYHSTTVNISSRRFPTSKDVHAIIFSMDSI